MIKVISNFNSKAEAEAEVVKIEFPCANYSLKIVGTKTVDYSAWVVRCVQQLVPELDVKKYRWWIAAMALFSPCV